MPSGLLALAAAAEWTEPGVLVPVGAVLGAMAAVIKVLWSRIVRADDLRDKTSEAHAATIAGLHDRHALEIATICSSFIKQIKELTDAARNDGTALNEKYHAALTSFREVIESFRRNVDRPRSETKG